MQSILLSNLDKITNHQISEKWQSLLRWNYHISLLYTINGQYNISYLEEQTNFPTLEMCTDPPTPQKGWKDWWITTEESQFTQSLIKFSRKPSLINSIKHIDLIKNTWWASARDMPGLNGPGIWRKFVIQNRGRYATKVGR